MKNKFRIVLVICFLLLAAIYIYWKYLIPYSNKTEINQDVYFEKSDNGYFSVYYIRFQEKSLKQELIATQVDSIIITPRYGTMIFGLGNNTNNKMWYYLDASENKNIYGGWSDSLFRNDEIITIGNEYLDSIMTSKEIWKKYNK